MYRIVYKKSDFICIYQYLYKDNGPFLLSVSTYVAKISAQQLDV